MRSTFQILLSLLGIFGRWVNWAVVFVLLWPLLMVAVSIVGRPTLTAIIALLPLYSAVVLLIFLNVPTRAARRRARIGRRIVGGSTVASFLPTGRKVLAGLAIVAGIEFAIGAYFAGVPVTNDRGLIPLTFLLILASVFLFAGGLRKLGGVTLVALIIVTLVFFAGGRDEAAARMEPFFKPSPPAAAGGYDRVINVGQRDEVEVKIPILYWVLLEPSRNIIIRRPAGPEGPEERFLQTPQRKLYRCDKTTGKCDTEVATIGSNISKVYIRSTADVARVEVSFTRM